MDASEIRTFVINLAVVLLGSCANSQSLPNEKVIPVFPNSNQPFYMMRETDPIGKKLGSLTLEKGPGLNIQPAGDEVNVTATSNTTDKLTVDVFLNKQFDYDSNISTITLNFFGSNVYYSNIIHSVALINHGENDEIPTFINLPYSVSVPETVAKGTAVYNSIQAIDRDKNDQLQYSLQGADEEYKNMFILDKYTAVLTLNGSLDFESNRFYQYKVTVLDQASPPHSSVADVFITVTDVQDTPPFFSGEPFIKTIVEETPVPTSIFTVKAEDGDKSIPNSISYLLLKETCPGMFHIDSHTGDISVKSRVDRDTGAVWNNSGICVLTILATEGNEHPQEPNSVSTATTTVTITVDDKNDNPPEFSSSTYEATLDENAPVGMSISLHTSIRVTDIDQGEHASIQLRVTSPANVYDVSPATVQGSGEVLIRVVNSTYHDYETRSTITIELEASQIGITQTAKAVITLKLNNLNDNSPVFTSHTLTGNISEAAQPNTSIMDIKANDADSNDDGKNYGTVMYSLENPDPSFEIDKITGQLTVASAAKLNREAKDSYYLTVVATDGGNLKVTTQLNIKISDENDEVPEFTSDSYQTTLEELKTEFGHNIKVQANDADEPNTLNSKITYSLVSTSPSSLESYFRLDPDNGSLTVAKPLAYEDIHDPGFTGTISLLVNATDNGVPPLSSTVSVAIFLQDINNHAPTCRQTMYSNSVKENLPIESLILQVDANDADGTAPNNLFIYSIDQKNSEKFIIDSTSGNITLRSNLDRETADHYNITVTVTDLGTPSRSSSCSVYLTVLDINDTPPTFSNASQTLHFSENILGLEILNEAQDKDQDKNLSYQIDWTQSTAKNPSGQQTNMSHLQNCLKINNRDGKITNTQPLDREIVQEFTLKIIVTDEKSDTGLQQDVASVTVYVDDVNDNKPTFSSSQQYQTKVQENMPVGTEIQFTGSTLVVEDSDQGNNSSFVVSLMNYSEYFTVEPPGGNGRQIFSIVVTNSSILDFEVTETLQIVLIAEETKTTEKFSNTATVTVSIENKNDNMPDFVDAPFNAPVKEESPPGTSVYVVKAVDNDLGEFGIVYYSLPEQPKEFVINRTTGEVTLSATLSREQQASYTLKVRVEDVGHFGSTTQLTVNLLDINNQSPNFTKQIYNATIPENQKFFMPPLVIQAFDGDEPGNKNSEIKYSISSISKNLEQYFNINPTSGEIVLNKGLDYESLDKSLHGVIEFYVSATDQSPPYHSVSATVQVTVLDVNDEVPSFSQSSFDINLPENMTHGSQVFQSVATDADASAPNNKLSYSIDTLSASTFSIDDSTGIITLSRSLDREQTDHYKIIVTASDNGNPVLTNTTVINITVTDVNDEKPKFQIKQMLQVTQENVNFTYSCTADDPDSNSDLTYTIIWNNSFGLNGEGSRINETYLKEWITIPQPKKCEIVSLKPFDREAISQLNLEIQVLDKNGAVNTPQTDTANIVVSITDTNDNPPVFIGCNSYSASIRENMPANSDVKFNGQALEVVDDDMGENSGFKVVLLSHNHTFKIDPPQGTSRQTFSILVQDPQALDFETNENFTIEVLAEGSMSDSTHSTTCKFVIQVINENDNIPEFINGPYVRQIPENSPPFQYDFSIQAVDKDKGEFGVVRYEMKDVSGKFGINETTGFVISKTGDLDRESVPSYTVTVTARDKGNFTTTTQLTIYVSDINDESPTFSKNVYQVEIKEEESQFIPAFYVHASDGDDPATNNSVVEYRITQDLNSNLSDFSINATTGEITINRPQNYESLADGKINLTVTANDLGEPSHTSTAIVTVLILDVNDNSPVFTSKNYPSDLPENATAETNIVAVKASDADGTEPNNQIYYVIQSGGLEKFQVNGSSGEISVNIGAVFDRDVMSSYSLTVLAIDKGNPPKTATATVSITLTDVNNKAPVITTSSLQTSVFENSTTGSEVINITATDPDLNPKLKYSLLWNDSHAFDDKDREVAIKNVEEWFVIDSQSGKITVNSTLDREKVQQITLKVLVEDLNAETPTPQSATGTVTITVLDVNDNPPQFSITNQVLNVSEATQNGTEITTFTATDPDKDQTVSFALNEYSYFSISPTGKLSLSKTLDRETQPLLHITVIATDNGSPSMSSSCEIEINVLDTNDNDPEFNTTSKSFSVEENSPNNTHVGYVTATDKDVGDNANVTYQMEDLVPFHINPLTGEITVAVTSTLTLDREKKSSYSVTVFAIDNPKLEQRRRTSLLIEIEILDVNDNAPVFNSAAYFGKISELSPKEEELKITPEGIAATDQDIGQNKNITYSFQEPNNGLFTIDPVTGKVKVKAESLKNRSDIYSYTVNATDHGKKANSRSVNLTITVLDENDNDPVFIDKPAPGIPECTGLNKIVYTFQATDLDTDKNSNGLVRYYLDNSTGEDWKLFTLDPESGELMLKTKLDTEVQKTIQIHVIAQDQGIPPRSALKIISFNVEDVNDNPPIFDPGQPKTFSLKEETENVPVGTVVATDKDYNSSLTYQFHDDVVNKNPWLDHFQVTTDRDQRGIISVVKRLDRETVDSVKLVIFAVDSSSLSPATMCTGFSTHSKTSDPFEITITVEDIDDNPPVFKEKSLTTGFLSSTEAERPIMSLVDYVLDNDTAANSVHKFFQVGDLTADDQLLKGWSPDSNPHPLLVNINGSITTTFKFPEDAYGLFTLQVKVNDSAGSDLLDLKLYVVGKSQVVEMTTTHSEDELRHLQHQITQMLSDEEYTFVPDNILPFYDESGHVNGFKSILVAHAIEKSTGKIVDASSLLRIMDTKSQVLFPFNIITTEAGDKAMRKEAAKQDDRTTYILVAFIVIVVIIFIITLFMLLHTIRRFKRKLKAATIEVHGMDPINPVKFPGLDNDHMKGSNPIFMRNVSLDEAEDSVSQTSGNSMDDNAFNNVDRDVVVDEQELTLDVYGNDDPYMSSDRMHSSLDYRHEEYDDEYNEDGLVGKPHPSVSASRLNSDKDDEVFAFGISTFDATEI
ncbi:cadherin-23-like [Physella acuta]|uniref:cadherin-23-like n=1 Tax=Physella acuta TaxID=109671 RepID=UPI0027DD58F1|nr:cadherin-23-like [Physella acuta]